MFQFATTALALLSTVAITTTVKAQDFSWGITPVEDFPVIAFDQENSESEVEFKYTYEGTLSANKFLTPQIFQDDCVTPADASLDFAELIEGQELSLDVDIVQETITDSVHYKAIDQTSAEINFCVRVDYNYITFDGETESINFHETIVDISVDLTANFTLSAISTNRTAADSEAANAALDYPVTAYFCEDTNTEEFPGPFTQGSALQVCVKMDESVTEDVFVADILTFVVSQPDGPASSSTNIQETVTDPLTAKDCTSQSDGICNVKTQLPSKFFTEPFPADLQVDGVAILSFGVPGRRQLVAVPIQQNLHNTQESRELQDNGEGEEGSDGGANSDFGLEVSLARSQGSATAEKESNSLVVIAVAAVLILIVVSGMACCIYFMCAAKKHRIEKEEKEYAARMRSQAMKNAGMYQSTASVGSNSTGQGSSI